MRNPGHLERPWAGVLTAPAVVLVDNNINRRHVSDDTSRGFLSLGRALLGEAPDVMQTEINHPVVPFPKFLTKESVLCAHNKMVVLSHRACG